MTGMLRRQSMDRLYKDTFKGEMENKNNNIVNNKFADAFKYGRKCYIYESKEHIEALLINNKTDPISAVLLNNGTILCVIQGLRKGVALNRVSYQCAILGLTYHKWTWRKDIDDKIEEDIIDKKYLVEQHLLILPLLVEMEQNKLETNIYTIITSD